MPKRKKTRPNLVKSKKPMLPEGDLDTSMTFDERKQRLETYLHDFDSQVEREIKRMNYMSRNLMGKIKLAHVVEVTKLPQNIRKMTLKEYFAQGGEINGDAMSEANKIESEMVNTIFQSTCNGRTVLANMSNTLNLLPCTPVQAASKSQKKSDTESVAEAVTSLSTSRSTRSKKRKSSPSSVVGRQTRSKVAKVQEDLVMRPPTALPPTSTRRSSRRNKSKAECTPAGGKRPAYFNTPAITPKFDPRLPITPLLREAKPGERIMSLTGSPVVNHAEPKSGAHMYIPLGDGRTFHLNSEVILSPSQGSALDNVARRNIELLQKQLSLLLKVPPPQTRVK